MTKRLDADELRKTDLPYGMWTCADGREVLYNRYYKPIWERRGGPAIFANPTEWVPDITAHHWFYNDGTPRGRQFERRLVRILRAFQDGEAVP